MKKLFININDVRIRGKEGAVLLGNAVTSMDKTMEAITNDTQQLTRLLRSHFGTNKGDQFQKMVNACIEFSKRLVAAAQDMNNFQHQIAALQAKIFRYEEQRRDPIKARVGKIEQFRFDASTNETYFTFETMTAVQRALVDYSEKTNGNLKKLVSEKNAMHDYWFDTQYKNFSEFIEEIKNEAIKHMKIFLTYAEYLKKKIAELH